MQAGYTRRTSHVDLWELPKETAEFDPTVRYSTAYIRFFMLTSKHYCQFPFLALDATAQIPNQTTHGQLHPTCMDFPFLFAL